MNLNDLVAAWEAAVGQALAIPPTASELSAEQLTLAAGLRLRTDLYAGHGHINDGQGGEPTSTVYMCGMYMCGTLVPCGHTDWEINC